MNKDILRRIRNYFHDKKGNVIKRLIAKLVKSFFVKSDISSSLKLLPTAIDIGTSGIKLIQLTQEGKTKLRLVALDREEYSSSVAGNSIVEQRETLKRLIERNRISKQVVTAVSVKDVHIYNLSFPLMTDAELLHALYWKISQLKPFGLGVEGVNYDFIKLDSRLGNTVETTQQKLIAVCVPKDVIEQRVSLLEGAGLTPVLIGVSGISLANLSLMPVKNENEVVMKIDFGAEETALIIERGREVYFLRGLVLTSRQITRQIAAHCCIDEKEAECRKRQWGLSFWSPHKKIPVFIEGEAGLVKSKDDSSSVFFGAVSSLENLVVDIEHSFKYFSYQVSQLQVSKFDRLVIAGGGANLKNLENFLSVKLGVSVEKENPLSLFNIHEKVEIEKKDLLASPTDFTSAAGLALSHYSRGKKTINLLFKEKSVKLFFGFSRKKLMGMGLAIVLLISLISVQVVKAGMDKWKMAEVNKEIKEARAQLNSLQSKQLDFAGKEKELINRKNLLKARLDLLNREKKERKELAVVLTNIATVLPEEIWVTNLSYSDGKLAISGSASTTQLIMNLIDALKFSGKFNDTAFNYSQKEAQTGVYNFEITVQLKITGAGESEDDMGNKKENDG